MKSAALLTGLPSCDSEYDRMISEFMSCRGAHIVCGGSTATRLAEQLGRELVCDAEYVCPDIPPIGHIEGITLVTEGVITLGGVLELLDSPSEARGEDGATRIYALLDECDNVYFFVGTAESKAHKGMTKRSELITSLARRLERFGKTVQIKFY